MRRVTNAAQEKQPRSSWMLRTACQEIQELYLNIQDILEWLSWALDNDSVNAIESHRRALFSEVSWIEGVATREAQTRG
jgi:hypothetical protein